MALVAEQLAMVFFPRLELLKGEKMSKYVVNLERLMALKVTVDVDEPTEAVDKVSEILDDLDWDDAEIDQIAACCLATGDASYTVVYQKNSIIEE